MATVPVTELITRAREYADARDDGDAPYISDAALLAWLNQEHRRLVRRVARVGYAYDQVTSNFTTSVALADVVAVVGVFEVQGVLLVPVPRLIEGVSQRTDGRFWTAAKSLGTTTIGVGKTGTYRVRYIPEPFTLVTSAPVGGQALATTLPAGWEEVLVLGAALRAKAKEGSDTESPLLRQLYQDEMDDVEVDAANHSQEPVIRNVDDVYKPGSRGLNDPEYDWNWWYP